MRRKVRKPCTNCGEPSAKNDLCLPCYNREHYERRRVKAPGRGAPVKVKGWGYAR